jgi:hypothetical protein
VELTGDTPHLGGTKSTKTVLISTPLVACRARPSCEGTAAESRAAITIAVVTIAWNGRTGTSTGNKTAASLFKKVQILIFNCCVAKGTGLGIKDKERRGKNQEGKDENERSAHLESGLFVGVDDGIVIWC